MKTMKNIEQKKVEGGVRVHFAWLEDGVECGRETRLVPRGYDCLLIPNTKGGKAWTLPIQVPNL